ncbi:MAG: helix-turn-helix domain-containing protein [Bifidobacteriaceae bacterium]|jgi:DNA-binding XRE family transcriptional regulator|nr:helix-turn-helix domain-containing protein [Bifidobacteriaceae bacterium]
MRGGEDPNAWDAYARELGLHLHRARIAAQLSQERLAHAAGISAFTYRKLEHGQSNPGTPANPRIHTLVSLARALHIPTRDLPPPTDHSYSFHSVAMGAAYRRSENSNASVPV